jgi:hypothetical protein
MRIFRAAVLPGVCLSFVLSAQAQAPDAWKSYRVLPGYPYSVNSKKLFHNKKKKAGLENNIADFYLYRNGVLVKPPRNIRNDFFPAGCLCFKYDDTLLLNSGLGSAVGVGVGIKIYGHKFTGSLHANTKNQPVYKQSKLDTAYLESILAEPETQSLRLYRSPSFTADEVIIGEYRATYKKFYKKNDHDGDDAYTYTVRIIFKCRVTGGMDSLKTLTGRTNK